MYYRMSSFLTWIVIMARLVIPTGADYGQRNLTHNLGISIKGESDCRPTLVGYYSWLNSVCGGDAHTVCFGHVTGNTGRETKLSYHNRVHKHKNKRY